MLRFMIANVYQNYFVTPLSYEEQNTVEALQENRTFFPTQMQ